MWWPKKSHVFICINVTGNYYTGDQNWGKIYDSAVDNDLKRCMKICLFKRMHKEKTMGDYGLTE